MPTPLIAAIEADDLSQVQALLQAGADSNARLDEAMTPLMLAAQQGRQQIVEALIAHGADVNAKNALGWTALMKAIYNYDLDQGFPAIVSTLIEAGAEIETEISYGTRPLMLAAGYGQAEVIEVLLKAGADVFARNEGGLTARTMAEYKDYVQVINQLYEAELRTNDHVSGACASKGANAPSVVRFTPYARR
jgi:ankyrin repeat protein